MKRTDTRFHGLPPLLREMHAMRNESVSRIITQGLFVGGGSGAVIGAFRWLYDRGSSLMALYSSHEANDAVSVLIIFGILAAAAIVVGLIVRFEPLISGSGIPHVELVLNGKAPFPWFRVVTTKFVGTLISLFGGLSVGREGPSIQMGAAVGCGFGALFRRLTGELPENLPRFLISGSVAGMTAAFGAPIAGMLFAFEELRTIVTVPLLLFTASSAFSAWFVVDVLFGFGLVFPFSEISPLSWGRIWLAPVLGVAEGMLGVFYNAFFIKVTYMHDRLKVIPVWGKPVIPFMLSGILYFLYPQVLSGVGYSMPDLAGMGAVTLSLGALSLLLIVKIVFSAMSFASGVPGGLLMPMLFIGGISGAVLGSLALSAGVEAQLPVFLVLGMAGLFAATVRAPLTGTALVAEMCGVFGCLPEMLITAFTASLLANKLRSRPIYKTLKVRMHKNIRAGNRKHTKEAD